MYPEYAGSFPMVFWSAPFSILATNMFGSRGPKVKFADKGRLGVDITY